ncbi:condensation domain protein [Mycobacterium xenopi 4042]|uniref:Condensation domain protein n=1 Tax=Mycobacterium xenopi 4042 TaxID=1299334 RepID=X8E7G8_MYCXE|nr:condensation domain protein [Mycobacterium xenopi 4042]
MLMIHHLAVDGVSWRILLEDINIAWPSTGADSRSCCLSLDVFCRWATLLAEHARHPEVVEQAQMWRGSSRCLRCSQRSARSGYV